MKKNACCCKTKLSSEQYIMKSHYKYAVFLLLLTLLSGCSTFKNVISGDKDNPAHNPTELSISEENITNEDILSIDQFDSETLTPKAETDDEIFTASQSRRINGATLVQADSGFADNCKNYGDCQYDITILDNINYSGPVRQDKDNNDLTAQVSDEQNEIAKEQELLDTALEFIDASQEFWIEGNLEKANEALDEAYTLVLEVNTDAYPELVQQREDMRFMISKRILEIYASRYTAVNGNHKEIPLTMNKHVEKEIKRFL